MNIEKTQVDELNLQLTLTITNDDYAPVLKKKLNDRRRTADIKGFRKGMAPIGLIQKLFGTQALYEAINDQISTGLQGYIEENGLKVLGEPLSSDDQPENEWEAGKDFSFKFDIGVSGPIDFTLGKEDSLPYYTISVTDIAKAEMKENMLRQMGSMQEGETAGEEDFVIADLSQEGKTVEGAYISVRNVEGDAHTLFLGAKVGDQFDINVNDAFTNETDRASMLKVKKEELAELDPAFQVKIINVKTFVPASESQEVYDKLFGEDKVHDTAEFDAAIAARLEDNYRQEADYQLAKDLKGYLLDKAGVKLPEAFLKRWLIHINEGKYTAEDIDKEFPMFIEDFRWQMVRDYLMEKYELKVDYKEVQAAAESYAAYQYAMYGMSGVPADMISEYAVKLLQDENQLRRFSNQVEDQKVITAVREEISLESKEISVEEFRAL